MKYEVIYAIFIVLFRLFLISLSLEIKGKKDVRIGFIFILTAQRPNRSIQQPLIWEKYFLANDVSRQSYVTAVVNWHFLKSLPKFVNVTVGHETDYGRILYIETILETSYRLIYRYNVTGIIILSGSCLPIQPFNHFYSHIQPILARGSSILPERSLTSKSHTLRYHEITKPQIPINEWRVHQAQGYCLHQRVIRLLIREWRRFRDHLAPVHYLDEHYLSYMLHTLVRENNPEAIEIVNSLVRNSTMYDKWNEGAAKPYTWRGNLTRAEVEGYREKGKYFMRKVSSTCSVEESVILL